MIRIDSDAVRMARLRRLWTQEQLAQAAGVRRATVSAMETGRHQSEMSTIASIAKALHVPATTLYAVDAVPAQDVQK